MCLVSVHSITSIQQLAEQQNYMIEASALLVGAQRQESEGNYFEAYDLYKETIETLLAGARKDDNEENVVKVKQKISSLLDKANDLYESHLVNAQRHGRSTIGISEADPNYEVSHSHTASGITTNNTNNINADDDYARHTSIITDDDH